MNERKNDSPGLSWRAIEVKRGTDWICRLILLCVWLAVWLPRLSGPIDLRWDASTYYVLGTALNEGKGYRLLNEPGDIRTVQYPPLLPLIISAHQRALGTTDYFKVGCALRLTYFVLSGLLLLEAYQLARWIFSPLYSLLVGIITALSFNSFLELSDVLYAEIPFAVVALAFLLLQRRHGRPSLEVLKWLLLTAAYLLRTAGLALLLAWVAESLLRRRFRQALLRGVSCAVPVVCWQLYIHHVTQSDEYLRPAYSYQRAAYYYPNVTYRVNSKLVDPFRPELGQTHARDVLGRIARNIVAVPKSLGESAVVRHSFAPLASTQLARLLHLPDSRPQRMTVSILFSIGLIGLGLFAIAGAILVGREEPRFLSLYFGLTLLIVVLTPWSSQFWRYLAPLTPLTLIFVLRSLFAIRLRWPHSTERRRLGGVLMITSPLAAILLVQAMFAVHLFHSAGPVSYYDAQGHERVFKLIDYGSEWHALDPVFEWVRRHGTARSVVATTVPHLAYLRTGHKAVLPPFEVNTDVAIRLLDEVPVKYLVVDRFKRPGISERYAAPLVAARPADWQLVFTAPDGRTGVYERTY